MRGYLLNPGEADFKEVEVNGYKDISAAVGGMIEAVPITEKATVYCNEEGKLINLPASALWMYEGAPYDCIAGPILVLGPPDEEGEDTAADLRMLGEVAQHLRFPITAEVAAILTREPSFKVIPLN